MCKQWNGALTEIIKNDDVTSYFQDYDLVMHDHDLSPYIIKTAVEEHCHFLSDISINGISCF